MRDSAGKICEPQGTILVPCKHRFCDSVYPTLKNGDNIRCKQTECQSVTGRCTWRRIWPNVIWQSLWAQQEGIETLLIPLQDKSIIQWRSKIKLSLEKTAFYLVADIYSHFYSTRVEDIFCSKYAQLEANYLDIHHLIAAAGLKECRLETDVAKWRDSAVTVS